MSLRAQAVYLVPDETARVARAAFPKGTNPYMRIRDHLGMIYDDQDFTTLFPTTGQPAASPFRLALTSVLQFCEGLSDRQAADAVRSRLDWKYALALPLEDAGFDASVLSEFRARLIAGRAERLVFDTLLPLLRDQGFVNAGGQQRTDSTHVRAAIHSLNRLELLGETLRHTLNDLAVVAPDWLVRWVPPTWFDRYGTQSSDYRLPTSRAKRTQLAEQIGTDGRTLLALLYEPDVPVAARDRAAIATLRAVWEQQFQQVPASEPMQLRAAADLPASAELVCSPYDPAARYRRKRDTEWIGYAVHLTETCDDDLPHVLTNVETTQATCTDNQMTGTIQQQLAAHALTPREHYVDAGYVTAEHLVSSAQQGTDLVGPVIGDQSWQARAGTGFGAADFHVDGAMHQATCPEGKQSVVWKPTKDVDQHDVLWIRWNHADSRACPKRTACVKTKRPRSLTIRRHAEHEALQAARRRQSTVEFKERYKRRAGSEGTISQGVQLGALRRSRYIGVAKTRLLHLLIGTAMNMARVAAWLAGRPHARTRTSAFAALKPACVP